jgi:carbonic anhydrase/acetyltransferase-like protein (isoleucine patch superfamily)
MVHTGGLIVACGAALPGFALGDASTRSDAVSVDSAPAVHASRAGARADTTAAPGCHPTAENRPVCAEDAALAEASFLDPTVTVARPSSVRLAAQVYVGPFAELRAVGGRIHIGPESDVQDSVQVHARGTGTGDQLARVGLRSGHGVVTGERVILAHGSTVKGPARLGVGPERQVPDGDGGTVEDSGVFVSFGAEVDGAVLERDTGLSALARVGPGVRLRAGYIVLPGKNVTKQSEADDPALGKVRPVTAADREFNAAVVEVNTGLAREYSRLARQSAVAVQGINLDPGGNDFNPVRDLPTVESDLCTGPEVRRPQFRNRIIGDVCFEDSLGGLDRKLGRHISLRADEGGPFGVGTIARMADRVIFHALEHSDLRVGDRVRYGRSVIVHGGGRPSVDPATGLAAQTVIGNDVTLNDHAIVFRSLVRNDVVIGARSIVVGSELRTGQRIGDRTVYANDEVAGRVEW